ncbi:MAG: Uma2 family endonuclease [Bacteroidota bacterium]|nr:Uma2 family endonuclease [Bacteroidota bacterium]
MKSIELNKIYTVQEYFLLEESGEIRHEFINGNLIQMSGASREHHFICQNILLFLLPLLKPSGYKVYMENMKVKIENENQYYYPDTFITREPETDENRYVQFQPELIIEVLSETTRTKDLIDKFIQYRKISTLKYYLVVEAQKCLILCNGKDENGEWDTTSYAKPEETIQLALLILRFP